MFCGSFSRCCGLIIHTYFLDEFSSGSMFGLCLVSIPDLQLSLRGRESWLRFASWCHVSVNNMWLFITLTSVGL